MASIFKKKRKRNAVYWIQYTDHLGIPYENEEGIADFHAAGRHTHITQLLRSGASITEARELARHTDVRMTMKYTHIGMADQARALAGLPSPQVVAGEEALHMRCISRGGDCRKGAEDGISDNVSTKEKRHKSLNDGAYGVDCQEMSFPLVVEAAGIEPENESAQSITAKPLVNSEFSRAAYALHTGCSNCQLPAVTGGQASDRDALTFVTYYCFPTADCQGPERDLPKQALTPIASQDNRSNSATRYCTNAPYLNENCLPEDETNFLAGAPKLERIVDAWDALPPHIQETIVMLVDSARQLNADF